MNTELFSAKKKTKKTVTELVTNNAGGSAYALEAECALAQAAVTGTFGNAFYVNAEQQLESIIKNASQCSDTFLAKLAVFSKRRGKMRDMSALLVAILAARRSPFFTVAFRSVIRGGSMLRRFCGMLRSGKLGRSSFGSRPKFEVNRALNEMSITQLIASSVGNSPSIKNIMALTHPTSKDANTRAAFSWIYGNTLNKYEMPVEIKAWEDFKANPSKYGNVPDVPVQMLSNLKLSSSQWMSKVGTMTWNTLRQFLASLERYGIFTNNQNVSYVANRLSNREDVLSSGVLPFQIFQTYRTLRTRGFPEPILNALQDALDISVENIPNYDGKVVVAYDSSGSMSVSVTNHAGSGTNPITCSEVATLFASAILKKNPNASIIEFNTTARVIKTINSRDSVVTNALNLLRSWGGTSISSAFSEAVKFNPDLLIIISDNESWLDKNHKQHTDSTKIWNTHLKKNPTAKVVCWDLVPNTTTQVKNSQSCLNIGGFSESVFQSIEFFQNSITPNTWVSEINAISLGVQEICENPLAESESIE